RAIGHSSGDVF
nr:immunoglobulin light chain junction region [Macaca mulatta]